MIVKTCPQHGDRRHQNGRYCNQPLGSRMGLCLEELTITEDNRLIDADTDTTPHPDIIEGGAKTIYETIEEGFRAKHGPVLGVCGVTPAEPWEALDDEHQDVYREAFRRALATAPAALRGA